jgi:hypothetical protein
MLEKKFRSGNERMPRRVLTITGLALASFILFSGSAQARVAGYATKEVGGVAYNIPLGYLHSPLSANDPTILIEADLPGMQPRTVSDADAHHGWRNRVLVLATDATKTTDVQYRLDVMPQIYGQLNPKGEMFGLSSFRSAREWFAPRPHPPGTPLEKTFEEIFVAAPPTSLFLDCRGDAAVRFPSCVEYFSSDNLLFSVSFGKSHLRDWKSIRNGTVELFRSFKLSGPQFSNLRGDKK